MVERYNCYIHTPASKSTGREICADGEHVLAADYAALEAERDEWKRRCEAMVSYIEPVGDQLACQCRECKVIRDEYETLLAIAEGRDNG
jgi:hypothetical protein